MPNHKIELSLEADKLTLGITEEETQLQSVNKLLASTCKLIELLNKSQISTKLILGHLRK
jgi:hypothetical protein